MSLTSVIDEEKVKKLLDATLKAIQTETDPHLLNQYRALIRKNVSFFRRSYLAAYLLMLQEQPRSRQRRYGGGELRGKPGFRNNSAANDAGPGGGAEPARQGSRPALQTPAPAALPEDESTRLFVNIGRNRRVFPREILGLIYAKTSLAKEDIGIITILNNYSFVQVRNSVAAELMDALNGISFRGKTLTVNHARTRKEDDDDPSALSATESALKPAEQDDAYDAGLDALDDDGGDAYDAGFDGLDDDRGDDNTADGNAVDDRDSVDTDDSEEAIDR
jgi:hypothetical protein